MKALHVGIATPLLHLPRPYSHQTVSDLNQSLRQLGERFNKHGTGNGLGPVVVAVVGRGRVAQGAIDALNQIRVKWVEPHQLQSFVKSASELAGIQSRCPPEI